MRGEYQTRQKREMTRFLAEHAMQCCSAEELARAMEAEGVRVGLTTAYRFLESLCRQQTARRYQDARGLLRYQYHGGDADCEKHFHVMCSHCGNMFHVDCEMVSQLAEHLYAEHGFRVDARESVLVGICQNCQRGGDGNGADGTAGRDGGV